MEAGRSFKLGAIRMAERFAQHDPLSRGDIDRLERHIVREAGSYLNQVRRRGFKRVIGTSGTILALGTVAATGAATTATDVRRLTVHAADLRRLRKRLVTLPLEERLRLPGLDPRRADLAPVGAILLETFLDRLGADQITLCDFALREGLVLDYIRRNIRHIRTADRYPDVRRRSVIELGERCSYLADHASQVAKLSLALFDATQDEHDLGAREREWLEFGALLHDVGSHINYEAHHKHSYYLIRHGELRGFDPEEVEVIGLIARYHRQATPKKSHEGFGRLTGNLRRTVKILGALVRLAEGLERSHTQVIRGLTVRTLGDGLQLRLKTGGDAELELWAAARHAAPLAEVLGKDITFETSGGKRGRARTRNERLPARAAEFTPSKRARNRRRATVASR
jgi:exopolyphosphatase/guanosine-5'-triphosphate,3'-diphosphate pyrophosphatase